MEHTETNAIPQAAVLLDDLRSAIGHAMVGQSAVIEQVLVALVASGHVLIEGVPGLGKTLLVRALARLTGLDRDALAAAAQPISIRRSHELRAVDASRHGIRSRAHQPRAATARPAQWRRGAGRRASLRHRAAAHARAGKPRRAPRGVG